MTSLQLHGAPIMLLAILVLLSAIPVCHTSTLATQVVTVEIIDAHADENNGPNENSRQTEQRELQQISIVDILAFTNGTCPVGCPLCECVERAENATEAEEMECTLTKSIEACASNTFQTCYADLVALLPGGESDLEGLCQVECANNVLKEGEQPSATCRMCDIFACCNDCPSERATECFPSNIEDGYTPPGWEPADCSGGVRLVGGYMGLMVFLYSWLHF